MRFLLYIPLFILIYQTDIMSQQLVTGDATPVSTVTTIDGKKIDLVNSGDQKVLLAFFRYAGCPVCNFRIHELAEEYDLLRKNGFEIVAVFESSPETLQEYLSDADIPFPLVADPELKLYGAYGVDKSFGKMFSTVFKSAPKQQMKKGKELFNGKEYKKDGATTRIPADFVLQNGKIIVAHYGKYIGDHLPIFDMLAY